MPEEGVESSEELKPKDEKGREIREGRKERPGKKKEFLWTTVGKFYAKLKGRKEEKREKEVEKVVGVVRDQVAKIADSEIKLEVLREQIEKLEETKENVEVLPEEQGLQEIRSWFTRFKKRFRLIDAKTFSGIKEDMKRIEGAEDRLREFEGVREKLGKEYSGEQQKRIKELKPLLVAGKQISTFSQLPEMVLVLKEKNIKLTEKIESETDARVKSRLEKDLKENLDRLGTIELFRRAWQEEAKKYVTEKVDPEWMRRYEERLRDRKLAIEKLGQMIEGESSVIASQRGVEGLSRLFGEEIEEPEEMPEILKGALRDLYREEADKMAQGLLDRIGWKVPEEESEQQKWLRERIVELRQLGLAPDLITSSNVWLDLVQRLSRRGIKDSVREEFTARLDLLRFGLRNTKLADPNLPIDSLFESAALLTSTKTILAIPEIQIAYDFLEKRAQLDIERKLAGEPRPLSPLSVDTEEKKTELIENLAEEFCRQQKLTPAEAKAFLGEAFDIYFYFGNFQYVEDSLSRPNSVHKVLNFSKWASGKFPREIVESFRRPRYLDKKGKPIGPSIGVGVKKPFHHLFSQFEVKDLIGKEGMGFELKGGRDRVFNWRGEECIGVSARTGEKKRGTAIFKKGEMEIEAIVYQDGERRKIEAADVRNPNAKVIAEALTRVKEGWLPGYIRDLRYGEKTRLVLQDKGLLNEPLGSIPGETGEVATKRLIEAGATGDLFAAVPPRRYEDRPSPEFILRKEDMIEAYVKGVLDYSKSEKGRKVRNYRVLADKLRATIIDQVAERELITEKGEKRLEKKHFGGSLRKRIKTIISIYTAAYKDPFMRTQIITGTMGETYRSFTNFLKLLLQYTLEGTGMEKAIR